MKTAWCRPWLESERGWGTRPDGYTIHKTLEDVTKFVDAYVKAHHQDGVPDVYNRPDDGAPYIIQITDEQNGFLNRVPSETDLKTNPELAYGTWGKFSGSPPPPYVPDLKGE